jgi:hypothetical protein
MPVEALMYHRLVAVAAVALLLGVQPGGGARAAECQAKPIKASGGAALLESTAKSRARSAWIKKVRADKRLGASYAAWLRAKDPEYDCKLVAKRFVCKAAATPCKV